MAKARDVGVPRTIKVRGKTYYFWRGCWTMASARRYSKRAIARGMQVHIKKDWFMPGGVIYTSRRLKDFQEI